jgi:transcriptional regulator with XRE-family HTH domain
MTIRVMARDPLRRLGANVRALRHARGMTQEQLAHAADLSLSDVGRIERAERDPGVRVLVRLARGLDVPLTRLLDGVG